MCIRDRFRKGPSPSLLSGGRRLLPMQLFTMPPPETAGDCSKTLAPPKGRATDISPPFTSHSERLELQRRGLDAISASKNDRWGIRGNVLVRVHRCLRQSQRPGPSARASRHH
eukprot:5911378-Alexandrium_andersonii.AAC.1